MNFLANPAQPEPDRAESRELDPAKCHARPVNIGYSAHREKYPAGNKQNPDVEALNRWLAAWAGARAGALERDGATWPAHRFLSFCMPNVMEYRTPKLVPRRAVLRGLGAEARAGAAERDGAARPAHRFLSFCMPNGKVMEYWTPKAEGLDLDVTLVRWAAGQRGGDAACQQYRWSSIILGRVRSRR